MPSVCDLHIHSVYSDGVLPPREIVGIARDRNLQAVAITDHDTIRGQEEALQAGRKFNVEVIRGLELSVMEKGKSYHILGYMIDLEDRGILDSLRWLREERLVRFEKILKKLDSMGIEITMDEVIESTGTYSYGRPHIARLMLEKGVVSNSQEAYSRYLGDGRAAYVSKKVLSMEEAIGVIIGAGGVPVWAHPGRKVFDLKVLGGMIEMGLKGLEVWHPNHDSNLESKIAEIADQKGLIPTGGSDFHSKESMKVDIGGRYAPHESVLRIRELADLT